jgi:hypothetical protein
MINHPDDRLNTSNDHGEVKTLENPLYNLDLRDDNLNVFLVFIRRTRLRTSYISHVL